MKDVQKQRERGDRLRPARSSRLYWHLTCLRKEMESVIEEHLDGRAVDALVDYGCGNSPYRSLFVDHVNRYLRCDLPGTPGVDIELGPKGEIPLDAESVDVVLSSQVLEHVPDPAAYLQEARRVLKSDGLLLLSTHGAWKYHPDPTDYWRWTRDGLQLLLEESRFRLLRFRGVMGPEATALQLWQDAVLPRVHWRMKNLFTRYVQWRMSRADRRCSVQARDKDACVFMVVAERQP